MLIIDAKGRGNAKLLRARDLKVKIPGFKSSLHHFPARRQVNLVHVSKAEFPHLKKGARIL